jgi:hypothetical protein
LSGMKLVSAATWTVVDNRLVEIGRWHLTRLCLRCVNCTSSSCRGVFIAFMNIHISQQYIPQSLTYVLL